MLATLLLLAQLVLPGPPSGPIQPPGMICLGECAGPVVWGPAERGRLVVACDMRSDTCSDGRQITTARPTPVPCEVSPGVWEIVPANVGCYSVRGLESWAQNTSYLSYGADLTKEVWAPLNDSTVEVLPDGFRIHPGVGRQNSGPRQVVVPAVGEETRTLTCLVRTYAPAYIRYWMGNTVSASFPSVDTGGKWQVLSATRTLGDGDGTSVRIGNGPASEDPVPFDIAGCWLTRTDTPGRPCWGGEAPVTCAADRHTISTEGWPTEAGEISISFIVGDEARLRYIVDGRTATQPGTNVLVYLDGRLRVGMPSGTNRYGPVVTPGVPHVVRLVASDGATQVYLDGMKVLDLNEPMMWQPEARLGEGARSNNPLNGSIRSLRIRSYEEVSP